MKTKVNKIPLVGPRGRKELLDRIEELEKKVAELATAPPETHILEILSLSDGKESEADALARLKLDGGNVTKEMLYNIDVLNTYILYLGNKMSIWSRYTNSENDVKIYGGYILGDSENALIDSQYIIRIILAGDDSFIDVLEL